MRGVADGVERRSREDDETKGIHWDNSGEPKDRVQAFRSARAFRVFSIACLRTAFDIFNFRSEQQTIYSLK